MQRLRVPVGSKAEHRGGEREEEQRERAGGGEQGGGFREAEHYRSRLSV